MPNEDSGQLKELRDRLDSSVSAAKEKDSQIENLRIELGVQKRLVQEARENQANVPSQLQEDLNQARATAQEKSSQVEGLRRELGTQQELAKKGQEAQKAFDDQKALVELLKGENERLRSDVETLQSELDSVQPALKSLADLRSVLNLG